MIEREGARDFMPFSRRLRRASMLKSMVKKVKTYYQNCSFRVFAIFIVFIKVDFGTYKIQSITPDAGKSWERIKVPCE